MTKVHIRAQFSQVSLNPVVQFCKICSSNIIQYIIPKPIILRVQFLNFFVRIPGSLYVFCIPMYYADSNDQLADSDCRGLPAGPGSFRRTNSGQPAAPARLQGLR